jgi:tRNA(Arg) A34 adenosine deaminase TadA
VTGTDFDDFDHAAHMQAALDLAREAADRGDEPFGSVLVRDDAVVMRESNRIVTDDDIRRHPELQLAHRAAREYDPAERAQLVMYTSTEPCPMCAGGMRIAGLGRVVYSVDSDEIAAFTGTDPTVGSAEILDGVTEVVGPVLNEAGRQIHEEFGW